MTLFLILCNINLIGEGRPDIIGRMARVGREGPPLTPADQLREVMFERAQYQAVAASGFFSTDNIPGMTPSEREQSYQIRITEYTGKIHETRRSEAVLTIVDELARFWKDQLARHPGDKAYATRISPHVGELKKIYSAAQRDSNSR